MGEKDHTQKMLIGCRDVFAELINVLVYFGEKVVNEADLLAGQQRVFISEQTSKPTSSSVTAACTNCITAKFMHFITLKTKVS